MALNKTAPKKAAASSVPPNAISWDADSLGSGRFEGRATIVNAYAAPYNYDGNMDFYHLSAFLQIRPADVEVGDEDNYKTLNFSAGSLTRMVPSNGDGPAGATMEQYALIGDRENPLGADEHPTEEELEGMRGRFLIPWVDPNDPRPKRGVRVDKSSNLGKLMLALKIAEGFEEVEFDPADFESFIGLDVEIEVQEVKNVNRDRSRSGIKVNEGEDKKRDDGPQQLGVISVVYGREDVEVPAKSSAVDRAKAAKSAKSTSAKPTTTNRGKAVKEEVEEPEADEADEAELTDDTDTQFEAAVAEAVLAKDVALSSLSLIAMKTFKGDKAATQHAVNLAGDMAWLGDDDRPWVLDKKAKVLKAAE